MVDSGLLTIARVEAIYNNCIDPEGRPRGPRDGVHAGVRFLQDRIEQHSQEIRELLTCVSEETRRGNSWRAFQFDQQESQWANPITASKLIALGSAAGFVTRIAEREVRRLGIPEYEKPWYRTTL